MESMLRSTYKPSQLIYLRDEHKQECNCDGLDCRLLGYVMCNLVSYY
jgi:hypothetical protein